MINFSNSCTQSDHPLDLKMYICFWEQYQHTEMRFMMKEENNKFWKRLPLFSPKM